MQTTNIVTRPRPIRLTIGGHLHTATASRGSTNDVGGVADLRLKTRLPGDEVSGLSQAAEAGICSHGPTVPAKEAAKGCRGSVPLLEGGGSRRQGKQDDSLKKGSDRKVEASGWREAADDSVTTMMPLHFDFRYGKEQIKVASFESFSQAYMAAGALIDQKRELESSANTQFFQRMWLSGVRTEAQLKAVYRSGGLRRCLLPQDDVIMTVPGDGSCWFHSVLVLMFYRSHGLVITDWPPAVSHQLRCSVMDFAQSCGEEVDHYRRYEVYVQQEVVYWTAKYLGVCITVETEMPGEHGGGVYNAGAPFLGTVVHGRNRKQHFEPVLRRELFCGQEVVPVGHSPNTAELWRCVFRCSFVSFDGQAAVRGCIGYSRAKMERVDVVLADDEPVFRLEEGPEVRYAPPSPKCFASTDGEMREARFVHYRGTLGFEPFVFKWQFVQRARPVSSKLQEVADMMGLGDGAPDHVVVAIAAAAANKTFVDGGVTSGSPVGSVSAPPAAAPTSGAASGATVAASAVAGSPSAVPPSPLVAPPPPQAPPSPTQSSASVSPLPQSPALAVSQLSPPPAPPPPQPPAFAASPQSAAVASVAQPGRNAPPLPVAAPPSFGPVLKPGQLHMWQLGRVRGQVVSRLGPDLPPGQPHMWDCIRQGGKWVPRPLQPQIALPPAPPPRRLRLVLRWIQPCRCGAVLGAAQVPGRVCVCGLLRANVGVRVQARLNGHEPVVMPPGWRFKRRRWWHRFRKQVKAGPNDARLLPAVDAVGVDAIAPAATDAGAKYRAGLMESLDVARIASATTILDVAPSVRRLVEGNVQFDKNGLLRAATAPLLALFDRAPLEWKRVPTDAALIWFNIKTGDLLSLAHKPTQHWFKGHFMPASDSTRRVQQYYVDAFNASKNLDSWDFSEVDKRLPTHRLMRIHAPACLFEYRVSIVSVMRCCSRRNEGVSYQGIRCNNHHERIVDFSQTAVASLSLLCSMLCGVTLPYTASEEAVRARIAQVCETAKYINAGSAEAMTYAGGVVSGTTNLFMAIWKWHLERAASFLRAPAPLDTSPVEKAGSVVKL